MELELMDILNRHPELTVEEAVIQLLTEKTRARTQPRPTADEPRLCRTIAA